MDVSERIGRFGVWVSRRVLPEAEDAVRAVAAELDASPFGAFWLGGSPTGDLRLAEALLSGSERLFVGTSIVNIWTEPADLVAASTARLDEAHPGRFLLGIGSSHAPNVESATGQRYEKPYSRLVAYLDELDAAGLPPGRRALAALGPRTVALAAERSAGALPYLTTPDHTRGAREIMGPDALLVAEQTVVLETDATTARERARGWLRNYLQLPNYVTNLRRLGFTEDDVRGSGSDRLVDAVVPWGDAGTVLRRVTEHLDAGADHVAIQALPAAGLPREEWARLGAAL